jgi:hypothetical protein
MSCGVVERLTLVAGFCDDAIFKDHHGSDRDFILIEGDQGLIQRFLHPHIMWLQWIERLHF